jgi:hypothetical protein
MMSVDPPGTNPTIARIGLAGKACPELVEAVCATAPDAVMHAAPIATAAESCLMAGSSPNA